MQELANYLVMMQQLGERLAPGAYVAAARRAREGVRDMTMFLAVHMACGLKFDVQRHPEVAEVFAQLTEKAREAPAALLAIFWCYFSVCSVMQGAAAELPQPPVVSGPCMRGGGRRCGQKRGLLLQPAACQLMLLFSVDASPPTASYASSAARDRVKHVLSHYTLIWHQLTSCWQLSTGEQTDDMGTSCAVLHLSPRAERARGAEPGGPGLRQVRTSQILWSGKLIYTALHIRHMGHAQMLPPRQLLKQVVTGIAGFGGAVRPWLACSTQSRKDELEECLRSAAILHGSTHTRPYRRQHRSGLRARMVIRVGAQWRRRVAGGMRAAVRADPAQDLRQEATGRGGCPGARGACSGTRGWDAVGSEPLSAR